MPRFSLKREDRKEQTTDDLSGNLPTITRPYDAASEAYRILRTNLLYARTDAPTKVVVLTSPDRREGKSTICANLGVVVAQADKNVLILDCDFHEPAMHKIFGLQNLRGVADVLIGRCTLQEIWQEPLPRLKVGTSGPILVNRAELLGSERFAELLSQVRQKFDYVLIDVPATQLVSDPIVLSAQVDGVLVVIDAQNTRKGSVRESIRSLESVGAHILGAVVNNVEVSKGNYTYR